MPRDPSTLTAESRLVGDMESRRRRAGEPDSYGSQDYGCLNSSLVPVVSAWRASSSSRIVVRYVRALDQVALETQLVPAKQP